MNQHTGRYAPAPRWLKAHAADVCFRYIDYRNGPDDPEPYQPSTLYWHVLAARLMFVLVFQVSGTAPRDERGREDGGRDGEGRGHASRWTGSSPYLADVPRSFG